MRKLDNDCKKQSKRRFEQINLDMSNLLFIFLLPSLALKNTDSNINGGQSELREQRYLKMTVLMVL